VCFFTKNNWNDSAYVHTEVTHLLTAVTNGSQRHYSDEWAKEIRRKGNKIIQAIYCHNIHRQHNKEQEQQQLQKKMII